jgi:hypothetical protein
MRWLKRVTARKGNRILGLTRHPFWRDENFDRLGLVKRPEAFPWSGASPRGCGWLINRRPIVNRLGTGPTRGRAGCQPAAGYQPAPHVAGRLARGHV